MGLESTDRDNIDKNNISRSALRPETLLTYFEYEQYYRHTDYFISSQKKHTTDTIHS